MQPTPPASDISIGNIRFSGRAFLAPMAGITDRSFRKLAAEFGATSVTSEMVASNALASGHADMHRKLARSGELPHIVQLAGNEREWLVRGTEIAMDAGAQIIDLNLGCPSKRVTNGYAGSALMRKPDLALSLIEAVVETANCPVTVKMRLGWNDESLNAADIARRAVDAGVQLIAVHGRTRAQFYKGHARWHLVRDVVDAVSVPVLVNGDIVNSKTARDALRQSGAAGVMIGRGAQGQPWIVGDINAQLMGQSTPLRPSAGLQLLSHMLRHHDMILSEYGRDLGMRVARKHMDWYLDRAGIAPQRAIRRPILTAPTPEAFTAALRGLFDNQGSLAA